MITGLERKINIMKLGKGGGQERSKEAARGKLECFLNQNEKCTKVRTEILVALNTIDPEASHTNLLSVIMLGTLREAFLITCMRKGPFV